MKKEKTRETILNGLLVNTTVRETSKAIGISEATIYRYLKEDGFKEEYEQRRRAMLEDNCHKLQASMAQAIDELIGVINDKEVGVQVKLNAIDMLLRHTQRLTDQIDIMNRIENLENYVK